jgi:hypothetical protein
VQQAGIFGPPGRMTQQGFDPTAARATILNS